MNQTVTFVETMKNADDIPKLCPTSFLVDRQILEIPTFLLNMLRTNFYCND